MWKESILYHNLAKVYGEDDAISECERLARNNKIDIENIHNIYEITNGNIAKKYTMLLYFGFDPHKFIVNLIRYIIVNRDDNEIKENDEIMEKITEFDIDLNLIKKLYIPDINEDDIIVNKDVALIWGEYDLIDISNSKKNFRRFGSFRAKPGIVIHVKICCDYLNCGRLSIPNTVKYLEFGLEYCSQITVIPNHVTHVKFHSQSTFNQTIVLSDNVERINFGSKYNQITILSNNIKNVEFDNYYNQPTNIPNSVRKIKFGAKYNQPTNIPNSVKEIKFDFYYNQPTIIPNSVENIEFGCFYNQETHFPNSIKTLILGPWYTKNTVFPTSIETLIFFATGPNQEFIIPNSIKTIIFKGDYDQHITIPNSVETLEFCWKYNQETKLPNSIKNLRFKSGHNIVTTIPPSVKKLFLGNTKIQIGIDTTIFKFEK